MKLLLWAQHWVFNILFHILQQLWLYSNSLFCTLLCNNCLWKCNYNGKSRSCQNIFERFYIFCNVSSASSIILYFEGIWKQRWQSFICKHYRRTVWTSQKLKNGTRIHSSRTAHRWAEQQRNWGECIEIILYKT